MCLTLELNIAMSGAALLMSIFLFDLTHSWQLQQQQQEDIGCFVDGRCEDSPFISFEDSIANANDCLLFCNNTIDCQYFTYQTSTKLCIAYSECVNLTSDFCNDCISGHVNCSDDNICYLPGLCSGTFEGITIPADQEACRGDCLANEECEYFSFDTDGNVCLLTSTCEVDETCLTCVYGKRECITEGHDLSKIMIVTGYTNAGPTNDVEIVDMSSPIQTCEKPPNYPLTIEGQVAAMIDNFPWVCGGGYSNACYKYDYAGGTWLPATSMNQNRFTSAADLINGGTEWWITGGLQSSGVPLVTTEILRNDIFYFGPNLPVAMHRHCLVTINNTHVFLAGGRPITTNTSSSHAYIIDFASGEGWQQMDDMTFPREFHSCNLINTEYLGPEIVVMGGPSTTTEIFNLENLTWRIPVGSEFPEPLQYHETVPYKESFLSIGGYYSGVRKNFIYYFNTTTWSWQEELQTVVLPRTNFVAIMLEGDMVHCG